MLPPAGVPGWNGTGGESALDASPHGRTGVVLGGVADAVFIDCGTASLQGGPLAGGIL